jgi:hypothetical protein
MDEAAGVVRTAPLDQSEVPDLAFSFHRFVEVESPSFHGALYLLTQNPSGADDLMQDAFPSCGNDGSTCMPSMGGEVVA